MIKTNLACLILLVLTVIISCDSNTDSKLSKQAVTGQLDKRAPFYTRHLPNGSPRISKNYDPTKVELFFPFILYNDGSYMVSAEIDEMKLDNIYRPIFQKYNYDGTGYDWAALIKLVLRKENPELEKHLQFDAEGGGFYLFADSEMSQRRFASFMAQIFTDTLKIHTYLKNSDSKKFENLGVFD